MCSLAALSIRSLRGPSFDKLRTRAVFAATLVVSLSNRGKTGTDVFDRLRTRAMLVARLRSFLGSTISKAMVKSSSRANSSATFVPLPAMRTSPPATASGSASSRRMTRLSVARSSVTVASAASAWRSAR